jgi:hypothetical protein
MTDNERKLPTLKQTLAYIEPEEATKSTDYLDKVFSSISSRFEEELELAQGRSNFQIEKFMGCNQYTISSQYKHILKNAEIMRRELFREIKEGIEHQREFEDIWFNNPEGVKARENSGSVKVPDRDGVLKSKWWDLEQYQYKIDQQQLAVSIKDKVSQLAFFDTLLDAIKEMNGGPITQEQFDKEEPEYWTRRLSKQMHDEMISFKTGIKYGNIESARNAATPTTIPGSINQAHGIPNIDTILNDPSLFLLESQVEIAKGVNETSTADIDLSEMTQLIEHYKQHINQNRIDQMKQTNQMIENMGGKFTIPEHPSHQKSELSNLDSLGISVKKT